MTDEYIIINRTAIQKRIEEWENKYGNEDIESSSEAFILMKEFLSESTPLIPEIEKAFDAGSNWGYAEGADISEFTEHINKEDYVLNLKLDI